MRMRWPFVISSPSSEDSHPGCLGRQASCLSIRGQDARKPSQAGSLTSGWEFAGRRSFLLLLVKNRADQVLGHLLEMGRLHRITGTALGKRTNGGRITEHLRKRHLRMHNSQISARFDAVDASATAIEVTDNVPLIFFRGDVFHFHDRL